MVCNYLGVGMWRSEMITTRITLHCDGHKCQKTLNVGPNREHVKYVAAAYDWQRVMVIEEIKDFCPTCYGPEKVRFLKEQGDETIQA